MSEAKTPGNEKLEVFSRRAAVAIVAALMSLALALRLVGLDHGLPHTANGDERYYESQSKLLEKGDTDLGADDNARRYPTLVTRIAEPLLALDPPEAGASLDRHHELAGQRILGLRAIVACLSILVVPATYLLGRRFLSRGPALFAAALAATSLLHQWHSQEARPHAPSAAFDAVAILAALALRRRPTISRYIAAGAALGLALAVLPSAAALLPAFVIAHVTRSKLEERSAWIGPLLLGLVAALCALLAYPRQRFVSPPPLDGSPGDVAWRFLGHNIYVDQFNGTGFATILAKSWEFDPWILLLCVAAFVRVVVLLARGPRTAVAGFGSSVRAEALVVLAFALPYFVVIGLYAETYERFALPLLSCAAVVAACALAPPLSARVRIPTFVLRGLIIVASLACSIQLAGLRAKDDTLEESARWIASHADRTTTRIKTLPFLSLPLVRTRAALDVDERMIASTTHPWMGYLEALDPNELDRAGWDLSSVDFRSEAVRRDARERPVEWAQSLDADLVLFSAGMGSRNELLVALRKAVRQHSRLLARVSAHSCEDPAIVERDFPFEEDPRWLPFAISQFGWRALGPAIEIWGERR